AINRGGEKFSCEEVENLILLHEKVHNAALVPMPDPILGEKACAFVSLREPGDTLTLNELLEFLSGKLAKFKLPERLEVRPDLPHTNIGKVKKEELREEIYAIMAEEAKAAAK
ncbi:MAG: 2,3-dihydroxybenzoate-AMP ligase, partial [Synergistaceae bacterium]